MYNFNWNAGLYDESHAFISKFGQELVELLGPVKGERILDLGCGTGNLTHEIYMKEAEVYGIDASDHMISQAKEKYPNIQFQKANAETFSHTKEFDGVFCNSVLHWIPDLEKPLTNVYKTLKPGGRFVAEMGAEGNIQTIAQGLEEAIKKAGYVFKKINFPWYFSSIGHVSHLLEKIGFQTKYAIIFNRPTLLQGEEGLRNWISMFGEPFFKDVPTEGREKVLKIAEEILRPKLHKTGQWEADYVRLRFLAYKKVNQ